MPGVPRELTEHSLKNVRPDARPVKQPMRHIAQERRKVVGDEVAKLLASRSIVEVQYPNWLANPVLVEKKKEDPKATTKVHNLSRV